MQKIMAFFIIIMLVFSLKIAYSEVKGDSNDSNQVQSLSRKDIVELKNKIDNLQSSLYQRVLEDTKISLDSSKQATSLVSVASYIFILISFLLGLLGLREWGSISRLRKKAEKDLNLVRHFSSAEAYARNGINLEAIREFEEILKIEPNNLIAHTQLGYLYSSISKERAIEHSKKAAELDKNNFTAFLNWGVNLSHTSASKRDVLTVYGIAEKLGEEQKVDGISLGKVKMFMGHCHKDLKEWDLALKKYGEAKEKFDNAKKSGIPDIVGMADWWLKELNEGVKQAENLKK